MTIKFAPPDNTRTARHKLQQLVLHQRYSDKVIVSGSTADADEIRQSFRAIRMKPSFRNP